MLGHVYMYIVPGIHMSCMYCTQCTVGTLNMYMYMYMYLCTVLYMSIYMHPHTLIHEHTYILVHVGLVITYMYMYMYVHSSYHVLGHNEHNQAHVLHIVCMRMRIRYK